MVRVFNVRYALACRDELKKRVWKDSDKLKHIGHQNAESRVP